MESRYRGKGLKVVGLHAPEFEKEKDAASVRAAARRLGISYPIVMDNDFRMWEALGNRYWPTLYLVDRKGRIRQVRSGETHEGDEDARELEEFLKSLLNEPS